MKKDMHNQVITRQKMMHGGQAGVTLRQRRMSLWLRTFFVSTRSGFST
jgi:hypothetical protein